MAEELIGKVSHYFGRIDVAAFTIEAGTLAVGDTVHIKGATSDFTQSVGSMQIEGRNVSSATVGDSVGLKVGERARVGDSVFKVVPD